MLRLLSIAVLAALVTAAPVRAGVTGKYVEVRNCDVWTGPCFANAEGNLTGKNAVLVWQIDEGTQGGVRLDGLTVVAVVQASDTLGLDQTGQASAVLIVDSRATQAQRDARETRLRDPDTTGHGRRGTESHCAQTRPTSST